MNVQEIISGNWSYRPERYAPILNTIPSYFDIVRCDNCAFIYSELLPSKEFLSFVYDDLIDAEAARQESYSPHNLANRMEYLAILVRYLEPGDKVLDYGCGFGPTLALLRNFMGIETVGFETSLIRARELDSWHHQIARQVDALQSYGSFDAVILDNVLEHVPYPRQTINLISSVCADGAILYVSVPDIDFKYLRSQIRRSKNSELLGMDINPWEHLNYFDLAHLDALMTSAGFSALKQAALPSEVRIA